MFVLGVQLVVAQPYILVVCDVFYKVFYQGF